MLNIRLYAPTLFALALLGCPGPNPTVSSPSPQPSSGMPTTLPSNAPGAFPSVVPLPYLAPPPWPAPTDVAARIKAAKLDQMSSEGTAYHIHGHVDVFYQGQAVTVPAGIGIGLQGAFISPLHTHFTAGVLHIEANGPQDITLGQFFTEWNIPLTNALVTLNGANVNSPADLIFHDHDEVTVSFGPPPANLPTTFSGTWF
jgi:hypothetical protein